MARKTADDGDTDDRMKAANERAAKEIEDAERAEKEAGDPSKEREVSIDEDDEDDEPAATGGRRERRNGRSAHQQAREEAEKERDEFRRRATEAETRALALAAIVNTPRGEQKPDAPTQVEQELERAFEDAERLNDEWDRLPPEKRGADGVLQEYRKRMRAIDQRKAELIYQKNAGPARPQLSKEQLIAEATLESEYADVNAHPQGRGMIASFFDIRRRKGAPDSLATLKLAAEDARKDLGLGDNHRRASRAPDDSLRAKLAGGGSRHSGGPEPRPSTIRMTKEDRVIARATYPSLAPEAAYKRWAQKVGAKMVRDGERD